MTQLPPWVKSAEGFSMASRVIKDPDSGITYRIASVRDSRPFQFAWENRILRGYINLLVARHPWAADRIVAVRPKGNYNAEPPAFEFSIEAHNFTPPGRRGGQLIKTSRVAGWHDNDQITKDDVFSASPRRRADSKAGIARAALKQMFADGQSRPAADVLAELKKLHDLDERTVTRASTELGYRKRQEGFPATWWWSPDGDSDA